MSTPSYIPDIKANPHAWFHYYDRNRCGTLDKSEVITGLDETFPAIDTNTVRQIVNFLWPVFDRDGNGNISIEEFTASNGLCDTIVAQLNPHYNEEDAPSDTASAAGISYLPPSTSSGSFEAPGIGGGGYGAGTSPRQSQYQEQPPPYSSQPPSYHQQQHQQQQHHGHYQQPPPSQQYSPQYSQPPSSYHQHQQQPHYQQQQPSYQQPQYQQPHYQQPSYHQPPAHQQPVSHHQQPSNSVTIRCGSCGNMMAIVPPPGVNMVQTACPTCGTTNRIQL